MEIFPDFQCNLVVFGSIHEKWFVRPGFFVFSGSEVRIFVYRPEFKETNSEDAVNTSFHKHSPCRQVRKLTLTHCRGIRRMHLNSNVSACEQAPVSQFGSSAHGSLLYANSQFVKAVKICTFAFLIIYSLAKHFQKGVTNFGKML